MTQYSAVLPYLPLGQRPPEPSIVLIIVMSQSDAGPYASYVAEGLKTEVMTFQRELKLQEKFLVGETMKFAI